MAHPAAVQDQQGRHVLTLVRRARRRLFHNELLFQGANAGSAALFAFILLMVLGAQILRWEVALLLPMAAAGAGLYIARRRVPSPYRVAQMVDHRLGLADTLSTAFSSANAIRRRRVRRKSAVARWKLPNVQQRPSIREPRSPMPCRAAFTPWPR